MLQPPKPVGDNITNATKACDICLEAGLEQTQHQLLRKHPEAWKVPDEGSHGEDGISGAFSPPLIRLGCHVTVSCPGPQGKKGGSETKHGAGPAGLGRRHRET